jgi:sugar phosphate isomerase/epimerase
MQRSQLAINSVSTRQNNLEEALAAYAAAGFRNVEFVLPLVKDWLAQGRDVAGLRRLLDVHGLRAIGGFQTHVECFTPPESQQANHAIHVANARLIHDLGGGTLVVGTDGPAQPSLQSLDVVADALHKLAKRIEGMNVVIALEFNWSPLVKSLHSAARVVEKVNHSQVGILFDPAHYYTTATKFEHLTPDTVRWIKHVHVDDMRDKPGELSNCNSDRVLPGQGVIDLRAMIARLEQHGYRGFFSIELFNEEIWQLPVETAARQCYQSLLPYCE